MYLLYNGPATSVESGKKLKPLEVEGVAKAILKEERSAHGDPKPGDLAMAKLKVIER